MRKVLLFVAALLTLGVIAYAQSGSLNWNPNGSNSTINGATSGTFTYALPAKSGTFAMLSDITAGPTPVPTPSTPQYFGSVTLVNGAGSVTFATPVQGCRVTDRSGNSVKYGPTANAAVWQFSGVGPILDYECR